MTASPTQMKLGEVRKKRLVKELLVRTRVGDAVTNLGDREITNEGILPEKTHFFNEGGRSVVDLRVTFGDIKVRLTP